MIKRTFYYKTGTETGSYNFKSVSDKTKDINLTIEQNSSAPELSRGLSIINTTGTFKQAFRKSESISF